VGDPGSDLEADRAQSLGDQLRSFDFAVRQLRMLMDLMPQLGYRRCGAFYRRVYFGVGDLAHGSRLRARW